MAWVARQAGSDAIWYSMPMPTKIKSDDDRKSFRYSFLSSALPSNSFIVVVVVIVVDRLLEGKEEREIETLVSMVSFHRQIFRRQIWV